MHRVRPLVAAACAALVVAGACGSQREEAELRAAAIGSPVAEAGARDQVSSDPAAPAASDAALPVDAAAPDVGTPATNGRAVGSPGRDPGSTTAAAASGATPAGPGVAPAAAGAARTGRTPSVAAAPAGSPAVSSAPAPGVPAPGGKGEIVIGSVGNYSGIPGTFMAPGSRTVQAWVKWVNGQGGVRGHPVRYVVADDGSDPARHQQLVREFVERRGVVAFVYNGYPLTGQASVRYLTDKRVPTVGSEGSGQWFNESPMYFAPFAHGHLLMESWLAGAAELLVPKNKKELGFVACQEVQFCHDAQAVWPGLAAKVGFNLAYSARVTLAQPSFTAECLGARNAGVQFFYVVSDGNSLHRLARDCKSVGLHADVRVPVDRHQERGHGRSQRGRADHDAAVPAVDGRRAPGDRAVPRRRHPPGARDEAGRQPPGGMGRRPGCSRPPWAAHPTRPLRPDSSRVSGPCGTRPPEGPSNP